MWRVSSMEDFYDGSLFVLVNVEDEDLSITVDEMEFKTLTDMGLIS